MTTDIEAIKARVDRDWERASGLDKDIAWHYSAELHNLAVLFIEAAEYAREEYINPTGSEEDPPPVFTLKEAVLLAFDASHRVYTKDIAMLLGVLGTAIEALNER